MTRYYVLDSSAIVCFLRGEHGADVLKLLLKDQNNRLFCSSFSSNLGHDIDHD